MGSNALNLRFCDTCQSHTGFLIVWLLIVQLKVGAFTYESLFFDKLDLRDSNNLSVWRELLSSGLGNFRKKFPRPAWLSGRVSMYFYKEEKPMEAQTPVAEWRPGLIGYFEKSSGAQEIFEFLEQPHKDIGTEWTKGYQHPGNLPADSVLEDLELDFAVATDQIIQETLEWRSGRRDERRKARVVLLWGNLDALTLVRKVECMRRAVLSRLLEARESVPDIGETLLLREIPALQKLFKDAQLSLATKTVGG